MSDGYGLLIDLLCVPCATCGAPHDDRVWVGRFEAGVYIAQCPVCYDREHPADDVDVSDYIVYLIEISQMELWAS